MKIKLIKDKDADDKLGTTVGWEIIAETTEEKLILGSIRHAHFWAKSEDLIEYNGYIPDPEDDNYVGVIKYATKAYKHQQHAEFINRLLQQSAKDAK